MSNRPGRRPRVDEEDLINLFKKRKSEIFLENGKLISKNNKVWDNLSQELDNRLTGRSLYSKLCENSFRDKVNNDNKKMSDSEENSSVNLSSFNVAESDSSFDENEWAFDIFVNKDEFEKLIVEVEYNRKAGNHNYVRVLNRLRPGLWEDLMSEEIYTKTKLECGFNFINHYLTKDRNSGVINGRCHCGSSLKSKIDNSSFANVVKLDCVVKKGSGKCGKRYLRQPRREEIAKLLCSKPAEIFRIEEAAKLMKPGDPEPPFLPNLNVLKNAKCEFIKKEHLHEDPRLALEKMQETSFRNTIHEIGLKPFRVCFWSNEQNHIFQNYSKTDDAEVAIDASGGMAKQIVLKDGLKSKTILMYLIVINTGFGQTSVAQMLTEDHSALSILRFLLLWAHLGAPHPKVVTTDASKALLIAVIRAFAGDFTINNYVDSYEEKLPSCFVRIDAAHFLKIYVNFLKDSKKSKRIRTFYKAAIGQLIIATDEEFATKLLKAILILAFSETDGNIIGKKEEKTQCEIEKNFLLSLLNPKELNEEEEENSSEDENNHFENFLETDSNESGSNSSNKWVKIGSNVQKEVWRIIEAETGEHDSAYYLPELGDKLLKDFRWFPLWSCVYLKRFGYGKIPASSAGVECEFKNIKTKFLNDEVQTLRVDDFVQRFVTKYLSGRSNLYISKEVKNAVENNKENKCKITRSEHDKKKFKSGECSLCSAPCYEKLCPSCNKIDSAPAILASREIENWRGLPLIEVEKEHKVLKEINRNPKKESRYFDKNQETFDSLNFENLKKIPTMFNGNHISQKAINFKGKSYSFTNTCPFDSLLQIFLVAAADNPPAKDILTRLQTTIPLFRIVLAILKQGLNSSAYRKRGDILKSLVENLNAEYIKQTTPTNFTVICEMSVKVIASYLLQNLPAFEVSSTCTSHCSTVTRQWRVLLCECNALGSTNFQEILFPSFPEIACRKTECNGIVNRKFTTSGPFAILEIDLINKSWIQLNQVPTEFQDPLNSNDTYKLIGIIRFLGDLQAVEEVGHYTAMCYRQKQWFEYNDLSDKVARILSSTKVQPELIIYFKTEQ